MLAASPLEATRWWSFLGRRFATALVVAIAFVSGLAGSFRDRPLETHEVYVAQTAREMMAAGDFVRPVFNAVARLNKPPLMYWCVIGVAKILPGSGAASVQPWVARLPSAFASALMAWFAVMLGTAVYGRGFGQFGALLGIGTVGWLSYSNNARPEMLYAALSVGMLACWATALGLNGGEGGVARARTSRFWALAGWVCAGAALLAKGPQIPVCLMVGVATFALVERRGREAWRTLRPLLGVPIMLAVAIPWVVAVLLREPGAAQAWTNDLFAGRQADEHKGVLNYFDPFYLYAVPGLILPWALLLPFGIASVFVKDRADLRAGRVLFWPTVVTVLIMGFSVHRRDYYMLALMPLMTLLCTRGVLDWMAKWKSAVARGMGPLGLLWAALICIWVCVGLGSTSFVWGTKRFRDASFAAAAAAQIRPGDEIWCFRTDFAKLVYALNRRVQVVDDEAAGFPELSLPTMGDQFVLTTIDAWEAEMARRRSVAGLACISTTEVARVEMHPGDNRDVLLKVTAPRSATPPP